MTSSAPSTTCALVITKPSALRMKPEPTPRCCGSSSSPRGVAARRAAAGMGNAEAAEEFFHAGVDLARCRPAAPRASVVRMFTTDGPDALDQLGKVGQLHAWRLRLRLGATRAASAPPQRPTRPERVAAALRAALGNTLHACNLLLVTGCCIWRVARGWMESRPVRMAAPASRTASRYACAPGRLRANPCFSVAMRHVAHHRDPLASAAASRCAWRPTAAHLGFVALRIKRFDEHRHMGQAVGTPSAAPAHRCRRGLSGRLTQLTS